MKRILVSGAGGYIGIPLCRELLRRGYHVIALDRYYFGQDKLGELSTNKNINVVAEDIRYFDTKLLEQVEGVIDLAGLSNDLTSDIDPSLTHAINLEGGARIAKAAKERGVRRYVYSSSASV